MPHKWDKKENRETEKKRTDNGETIDEYDFHTQLDIENEIEKRQREPLMEPESTLMTASNRIWKKTQWREK